MLFPRKPSGLGSSRADSDRWDGHSSRPTACCPFTPYSADLGAACSLLLGLWKEEPTKAQAAGDSTVIGYLAHPWLTRSQF